MSFGLPALGEKLSALRTESYFEHAKRADVAKATAILEKAGVKSTGSGDEPPG